VTATGSPRRDGAPVALITGAAGQDGTFLSQLLVGQGWSVHGLVRPDAETDASLPHLAGVQLHFGDLLQPESVTSVLDKVMPDHVFHLGGLSSVWASWQAPADAGRINGLATVELLQACLRLQERTGRVVSVVHASSSEIFAGSGVSPQDESTPITPTSPYGASKAYAHIMVQVMRSRGLASSNAVLFNHESVRRPDTFVTRKITRAAAAIALGRQDSLSLGNLSSVRDWGWAPDVARALQAVAERGAATGRGDDFVVATGRGRSVHDFMVEAFRAAGIDDWQRYVTEDTDLARPADGGHSIGNAAKTGRELGWRPTMTFEQIVAAMVQHDLRELDR
jgi:GDPmannose 4,6-dehydratase